VIVSSCDETYSPETEQNTVHFYTIRAVQFLQTCLTVTPTVESPIRNSKARCLSEVPAAKYLHEKYFMINITE
jgi:hypothetical protein